MEKHLTVSAIIIHGSKILLVNHKKLGVWLYPGGHLESNEDPIQGLKREIKEEVGQEVKILGVPNSPLNGCEVKFLPVPFAILSELISASTEQEHIHIDLVYLCQAYQPTVNANFEETDGAHWFSPEEIRALRVLDGFPTLIEAGMEAASHLSLLDNVGDDDSSPVRLSVALLVRRREHSLLFGDSASRFGVPIQEMSRSQSPDETAQQLIESWLSGSGTFADNRDERLFSNDAAPLRLPVAIACFPSASGRECVFIYEAMYSDENRPPALDLSSHKWIRLADIVITPSIFIAEKRND